MALLPHTNIPAVGMLSHIPLVYKSLFCSQKVLISYPPFPIWYAGLGKWLTTHILLVIPGQFKHLGHSGPLIQVPQE